MHDILVALRSQLIMEETFRLIVLQDKKIAVPRRLLNILGASEGDEVRIVTNEGKVQKVEAFKRGHAMPRSVDELAKRRLEEIKRGKQDSSEKLRKELEKPEEWIACH